MGDPNGIIMTFQLKLDGLMSDVVNKELFHVDIITFIGCNLSVPSASIAIKKITNDLRVTFTMDEKALHTAMKAAAQADGNFAQDQIKQLNEKLETLRTKIRETE